MTTTGGDDENDEALEAELLALQGKPPLKGKAPKQPKAMSMKKIDSMVASIGDFGEEVRSVCVCVCVCVCLTLRCGNMFVCE